MGREDITAKLRAARQARGWTLADVATALHQLDEALGEPESRCDLNHVAKWESGRRTPSQRYAARLSLVFDVMPAALGFAETPSLMAQVGELRRRRGRREAQAAP